MNDIVFNGKVNLSKSQNINSFSNEEKKDDISNSSNKMSENFVNTSDNIFLTIFTQSNIIFLFWFLAIYLIIYFILGIFSSSSSSESTSSLAFKVFDFLVFSGILLIVLLKVVFTNNENRKNTLYEYLENFTDFIKSPTSIFSLLLFLFTFYTSIFLIGIPMTYDTKPNSIKLLESGSWIIFIITLISWFCSYFLGISIGDLFYEFISDLWGNLYSGNTKTSGNTITSGNTKTSGNSITSSILNKKGEQVFNISNNLYTYDDSQAICKSYGARLATYDDIEKSYNNGGEWCNYGWSEGQMIYYPTQKSTWDKLQKDSKKKNNCGRPGVNGGYMSNPYLRFGVNCFGKKPDPKASDLKYMEARKDILTPSTTSDTLIDKKVKYWMDNSATLLKLNSFNRDKWSEY
jgi:hypothetical protein